MTVDSAWLVLGGIHHLNAAAPVTGGDPLVLVSLPAPAHASHPSNTVVLRWADLGRVELTGRDGAVASADGGELFPGMLPGTAVARLAPGPVVPLFYLAVRDRDGGRDVHVYSQIRFLADDACFIRVTPEPLAVGEVEDLAWLPEALRLHQASSLFLNNHQRYYRKCFPDQELEYKYTLTPPVDVWRMTVRVYQRLLAAALPGFIMEYRDEFQAWDYVNHLYQVTDPEPDRGYVSFIPTTDGRNLLKRKWFAADSFSRRETHTYGVIPEHGFDAYIRDELGLSARRLPAFRRARYDVNFESTRTGHVYGIFFDHVSLIEAPEVVLNQCELEYLRSRTAVRPDPDAVLVEIDEIAGWLEAFLREHGLNDERGHYSKLTFLLDAVAARPALASEVAVRG
ncbi:MAG TPA: hypothetical protein VFM37_04425 [Pseudonocardiaceae bacterium]|nr:hypothetical protein [Pseudonocardiaceae bacterium]